MGERRSAWGMGALVIGAGLACALVPGCETKPGQLITDSVQLGDLRAKGNEAFAAGRYGEAEQYYSAYVQRRPQEAEVEFQLGRTLLALGRPLEAQDHLRIAHDLDPGNIGYVEMLARAILATGSRQQVVEFLQRSAEGNMTAEGFMVLGFYAREAGFIDEAESAYKRAVALEGAASPEPHRELAKFYRSVGDSQSEVERLRMVLSFDDKDAQANQRLRELGEVPGPSFALEPDTFD